MRSLIDFVEGLREGGADFRSITEGIDTTHRPRDAHPPLVLY